MTPQLADTCYAHTLVIKSSHEWKVGIIWPMDLALMSTFDNQRMSEGCFLGHYLLKHTLAVSIYCL